MIITKATDLYPLYLPEPKTPRSRGLHVSGIIRCIATEAGILKPELADELSLVDVRTITDKVAILRINIGLAWEEHYIPMLGDVVDHPGEMSVDGCYMTHDGESTSVIITGSYHYALHVHEVKATYKSAKSVSNKNTTIVDAAEFKWLEGQWMWMAQIKAYCLASGTRYAFLHVLFLCGDYKYPITPRLEIWRIEFTQEEVDSNWETLMAYKTQRLQEEQP